MIRSIFASALLPVQCLFLIEDFFPANVSTFAYVNTNH